jgi:hypothetical protein
VLRRNLAQHVEDLRIGVDNGFSAGMVCCELKSVNFLPEAGPLPAALWISEKAGPQRKSVPPMKR